MSNEFRIINGIVFDPTNEIDGKVCDIFIKDGKIVSEVSKAAKVINANGMAVMPGGVDIHCHITGPKVNLARKLVNAEFFCSFIFELLFEKKLRRVGNNVKVIKKEVIKPIVIIQPKSIIGFISLNIKDRKAQIVVKTV